MDADTWAAIAAWGGFVATGGAGYYTFRQARTARDALSETKAARQIASDQANSARDSAESASKATDAAMWQARNMEQQTNIAQQQLNRADRPEFEITAELARDDWLIVRARMRSGPVGVAVQADCFAKSRIPVGDDVEQWKWHDIPSGGTHQVFRNGDVPIGFEVPADAVGGEVNVMLSCANLDDHERAWQVVEVVRWERPRQPQVWMA